MESLTLNDTQVVDEITDEMKEEFSKATVIALDVEGVDLCRTGRISIVQLSTNTGSYLLDVLGANRADPVVTWLKTILESENVVKVIHDCRMDSDALYHHWGIRLANVHDTSCWNEIITNAENENLNAVLSNCGLRPNVVRDGNVYKENHAFWATRPLTPMMIKWASGDVSLLLKVREYQIKRATEKQVADATERSKINTSMTLDYKVHTVRVTRPGSFIGTRGANIRALEKKAGILAYPRGERSKNEFMIFYNSDEGRQMAIDAASGDTSGDTFTAVPSWRWR